MLPLSSCASAARMGGIMRKFATTTSLQACELPEEARWLASNRRSSTQLGE